VATDMDGVLCFDPPMGEEAGYEEWLDNAPPKWLPRKTVAPLIVTARHERYRPQTEAWLRKWGVHWRELAMHPNEPRGDIGAWKASVLQQHSLDMFVESSDGLARRISDLWGNVVICTDSRTVYERDYRE
jgi:uncharacterized HAD superfamily protein